MLELSLILFDEVALFELDSDTYVSEQETKLNRYISIPKRINSFFIISSTSWDHRKVFSASNRITYNTDWI